MNSSTKNDNAPYGIAAGPDENIWFGETFNKIVGRVKIPDHKIHYFTLPKHGGPAGIVAGPGGYLYATEFLAGKVAQIDTSGGYAPRRCCRAARHRRASPSAATETFMSRSFLREISPG